MVEEPEVVVAKVAATPVQVVATPVPTVVPTPIQTLAWEVQLMQAVGIARSDWYFADCVIDGCEGISGEGSWQGTQRWNTSGSGAYGICQALPGSKMASSGADYMTNTLTQLKWCNQYAHDRYGSWSAAWTFRKCVGKCWQPVYKTWTIKDHTWW